MMHLRNKQNLSRCLKLAISAVFLMSVCGCATQPETPQVLAEGRAIPKLDPKLVEAPKKKSCIDPGAKQYQVPELEKGLKCYRSDRDYLHARLNALIAAEANREKELSK